MIPATNLSLSKDLNFYIGQTDQATGYTAANSSQNKPVDEKESLVFLQNKNNDSPIDIDERRKI